ncbi:hypothetical protein BDV18DRAFT_131514 [Aspergillus unguis]
MATEVDNLHPELNEATTCHSDVHPDDTATAEAAATLPELDMPQKLSVQGDHSRLDEGMQTVAQDSGYNSSGSSQHSPSETQGGSGELVHTRSRASSRTSISSIPASTFTNLPEGNKGGVGVRDAPDYIYQPWDHPASRQVQTLRQRDATFRKLSSVRAMQMHTEDEGDEDYNHLTPPKRRGSHRMSDISIRSAGSSPFKRSPFYSPNGTSGKPKAKKEYPLVLLHCSLLPPSLPASGLIGHPDCQRILREVLPSVYWKRWKLLEDKIGSGVLRDRGVLISHPEDMYDLLEERLLESLELQHPRLDHGHFLGDDETESDREDRLAREGSSTEDEGDECPDCGGRMVRHHTARKWELKVFAANGLMRAGAWAAAWKEMEKVDVEVGLWLPPNVRADLERRISEDSSHFANSLSGPVALLQGPENIQVEAPGRALTPAPLADTPPRVTQAQKPDLPQDPVEFMSQSQDNRKWNHPTPRAPEIDLQTLLVNYIRVLANDRRNIAIVLLSILVVLAAMSPKATVTLESDLRPFPAYVPEYTPSTVVSQQVAAQTWLENTISQTVPVASPDSTAIIASAANPSSSSSIDAVSDAPVVLPTIASDEPLPTATESSLIEQSDNVSEEHKQTMELMEDETEELPPTETAAPSVETSDHVDEGKEQFIAYGENEEEEEEEKEKEEATPLSATEVPAESPSDSFHDVSEDFEDPQASETALVEADIGHGIDRDGIADQVLPINDQHNHNEQDDEPLQNEEHEPNDQIDENEQIDI